MSQSERLWNDFYDKYGVEPKEPKLLLQFAKRSPGHESITYKTAREICQLLKGKGRIQQKLESTATVIIESLPTAKSKKEVSGHNILQLTSGERQQLLINGYFRALCESDSFDFEIPGVLSILCLKYLYLSNLLLIIHVNTKSPNIIDLVHRKEIKIPIEVINRKKAKCIDDDNDSKAQSVGTHQNHMRNARFRLNHWTMDDGLCYHQNVTLPSCISELCPLKRANIIFQANHERAKAVLFDMDQNQTFYEYPLPPMNFAQRQYFGNTLVFHERFGLISIGGGSKSRLSPNSMQLLSWNELDENSKWISLPPLNTRRARCASVVIEDKVMIISGSTTTFTENRYGGSNVKVQTVSSVELYDLSQQKTVGIRSMRIPRSHSGCCYDTDCNAMYLGGGQCSMYSADRVARSVEMYDLLRDTWVQSIPRTLVKHCYFPSLWTQSGGKLLFIASQCNAFGHVLEFIDLRVNGAEWELLHGTLNAVNYSNGYRTLK